MLQLPGNFDRAYLLTTEQAVQTLRVRRDTGLTSREVVKRQKQFGKNIYSPLHTRQRFFFWRSHDTATALRDHKEQSVRTESLVPGDIITVRPGDIVPADARLLTGAQLQINESMLTGEQIPARKHFHSFHHRRSLVNRHNMIYAGTKIISGSGRAVVTATGRYTEYAKAATRPLPKKNPAGTNKIDTICTDIFNVLVSPVPVTQYFDFLQGEVLTPATTLGGKEQLVLAAAAVASPHGEHFIQQCGLSPATFARQWPYRDSFILDTHWRLRGYLADHPTQGSQILFVTGSPEELLESSSQIIGLHGQYENISGQRRLQLRNAINNLAQQGFSLMGVGIRRHLQVNELSTAQFHNLSFMGVYVMKYNLVPNIQDIAKSLSANNPRLIFLTAEHPLTIKYLAAQAGLTITSDMIATGEQMQHATDENVMELLPHIRIWAHLHPLDRQRIVRLLEQTRHTVASS